MAIDQRGYNLERPARGRGELRHGPLLVSDVAAVVKSLWDVEKATIVGHDWGGAVAWQVAFNLPQMTERLIILNLPHPTGMGRELALEIPNRRQQRLRAQVSRRSPSGSRTSCSVGP